MADDARLDEFDKTEWRDVCRKLRPHITDEEFDVLWAEFVAMKKGRGDEPPC